MKTYLVVYHWYNQLLLFEDMSIITYYRLTITNPTINIVVPLVFCMNFGVQFQISQVGAPLFSGSTVYVLMALYPESAVCSHF